MPDLLSAATVKRRIPKDKLACFPLEDRFGWEQICSFLEKVATAVKYPPCNAPDEFEKLANCILRSQFIKFVLWR